MVWFSVVATVGILATATNEEPDLSSFYSIDANDDGKISQRELKQTGLPQCLNDMVELAYSDDTVDVDDDDLLSAEEWHNFFSSRLGRLVTVSEVVDWIIHGVQKPQYANVFRENSVSGLDFIDLVRNGGKLLEEELGITGTANKHIRRQMILVLCTDRPLPNVPLSMETLQSFHGVDVSWKPGDASHLDLVQFQLQRAESGGKFFDLMEMGQEDTNYLDSDVKPGIIYSYRVQAWSAYGRSGWSKVTDHTTATKGQPTWMWMVQNDLSSYLPGARGVATAFVAILCWFIPALATVNRRSINVSASSMESAEVQNQQPFSREKLSSKSEKSTKMKPDVVMDDDTAAESDTCAEGDDSSKMRLGASVEEGDGALTIKWVSPVECRATCKAEEGNVSLSYEWSTSPLVISGLTNGRRHAINLWPVGKDAAKYAPFAQIDLIPHRKKSYVQHMVDGLRWTP